MAGATQPSPTFAYVAHWWDPKKQEMGSYIVDALRTSLPASGYDVYNNFLYFHISVSKMLKIELDQKLDLFTIYVPLTLN